MSLPDRSRVGAAGILLAVLVFTLTVAAAIGTAGTSFVWAVNMISDLGDGTCGPRGGRWICSPGYLMFNIGLIVTGVLLAAAGGCLIRRWGRVLAGSVVVMGLGLGVAGVFPAGNAGAVHLAGVVLALVVPGMGLLISAIRPETRWLESHRLPRGVLSVIALVFSAENRLPVGIVSQGAGQAVIVACLLVALLIESGRVLVRVRPDGAGAGVNR